MSIVPSGSTTAVVSTTAIPATTNVPFSDASQTAYISTTISSIIAGLTPMLALAYLFSLAWAYRYAQKHPRALNKNSGVQLQRYAPVVYVLVVLSSLAGVALSSWLLFQYRFLHNYPNVKTRTGTRFLLFAAIWSTVTAGAYSLLFLHSAWAKYSISSVGAQWIWVSVTWILWTTGAGVINNATAAFLMKEKCEGVAYCRQLRALFALSIAESLVLLIGMAVLVWLAWQSTRALLKPADIPLH